jgi:VWFA-related protein
MAIVVDDLGMDDQSFPYVRSALDKFLAEGIPPGTLFAVIATSGRLGGLARLTNDARLLRAALERLRSIPAHRMTFRQRPCGQGIAPAKFAESPEEAADAYYARLTMAALHRVVDGLHNLPGRRSILLFSEGLPLTRNFGLGEFDQPLMDRYQAFLAHADRSGVAVNTIDPRGLATTADLAENRDGDDRCVENRRLELVYTRQVLAEMAHRTAGVATSDDNDLPAAINRVVRDQSGYYLVAWRPSGEPAAKSGKGSPRVRHLSIQLNRPGLQARFHSSIYAEEPPEAPQADSAHRLADAILSPFATPDIRVRVSSRFWDAGAPTGAVLDTDLRIDARDCSFTIEGDGRRKADIHLVTAIWGADEKPLDTFERSYTVSLSPAAYEQAMAEGLVQHLQMRVKRPGAYQIRAAVRDPRTERLGSASDFVEVPDLKRGKLALSGIALAGTTSDDAANGATRLRYHRGETVAYTLQILNAAADAEGKGHVEVHAALYSGGRELGASETMSVDGKGQADSKRWIAADNFRLGDRLAAGEYTLQVTVVDRVAAPKPIHVVQAVDFEVVD